MRAFSIILITVAIALLIGSISSGISLDDIILISLPGPDAGAKDWMQALATQDGLKLSELTCDTAQTTLQNTTLVYSAIGILAGSFLGGAQPRISVSELQYQTVRNDKTTADVRVTGRVRVAVALAAQVQDVTFTMPMRFERGKWRYCETLASSGIPNSSSATGTSSSPTSGNKISSAAAQRIQDLEARIRSAPDDIGALTQLGNEYFDNGQYAKAIDPYTKVLQRTPNNPNVRTDLGISYYYLGMVKDAVREYKRALEVEPNKVQTLSNLGIAYADLSPPDIDGAVTLWQKVIQLYPGTPDAKKAQELIDKYKK